MTPSALTRKVNSLAAKSGFDPGLSLRCINAAAELDELIEPEDIVLWSAAHGGLAWEAMGPRKASRVGGGGTVYCVLPDGFPDTPELWRRIDSHAVEHASGVRRIRLSVHLKDPRAIESVQYPPLIHRILNRIFPGKPQLPGSSTLDELFAEPPLNPVDIGEPSGPMRPNLLGRRILIDSAVDIQERFAAAKAVLAAGLNPTVSISAGESYEAALLSNRHFPDNRSSIIRVSEDRDAAAAFQIQTRMPILTPASEEDMSGALAWAAEFNGPVLIIEPGRNSLPSRIVFKKSWSTDRQIVVKEKSAGDAGKILFIVTGTLAREASKAAERLAKDNLSVTVLSLRFLRPLNRNEIQNHTKDFDLVVVADTVNGLGGLKSSLGLELLSSGTVPAIVPDSAMDGKALAEFAASAHRENRFLRTVDDVKKDRWR